MISNLYSCIDFSGFGLILYINNCTVHILLPAVLTVLKGTENATNTTRFERDTKLIKRHIAHLQIGWCKK